ncbi:hypothetical protein C3454_06795 [Citrobacter europaeus]|nr:hypothetical protein C3454_06795 [Citrobacter europaeus]
MMRFLVFLPKPTRQSLSHTDLHYWIHGIGIIEMPYIIREMKNRWFVTLNKHIKQYFENQMVNKN